MKYTVVQFCQIHCIVLPFYFHVSSQTKPEFSQNMILSCEPLKLQTIRMLFTQIYF